MILLTYQVEQIRLLVVVIHELSVEEINVQGFAILAAAFCACAG